VPERATSVPSGSEKKSEIRLYIALTGKAAIARSKTRQTVKWYIWLMSYRTNRSQWCWSMPLRQQQSNNVWTSSLSPKAKYFSDKSCWNKLLCLHLCWRLKDIKLLQHFWVVMKQFSTPRFMYLLALTLFILIH